MNKTDALPLYHTLLRHAQKGALRFHVPGHKGGLFFSPQGLDTYRSILAIDLTELEGLDYLHGPQGVIKEAQELAALQFGADRTYFLVNGSTVGNLAMILGCVQEGDLVLVQRNSHQSVYHGLSLARAQLVPLTPELDCRFDVATHIHPDHFHQMLKRYPQAKACLLTYPTYYGWAKPEHLKTIIELAHQHGVLVLVDEAHGAHFGQHPSLPPSALQLGADLVVQSTHKMLGSLTMTAMLHLRLGRVPVANVEKYLAMLQSSSPSYPLMASLDLARHQLSQMSAEKWQEAVDATDRLRQRLRLLKEHYLISGGQKLQEDPFKLVIRPRFGWSGFQLQQALRQKGVEIELADPEQICLTLPLNLNAKWIDKLVQALERIAFAQGGNRTTQGKRGSFGSLPHGGVPAEPIGLQVYREEETERVYLEESVGRRAAQLVTPYPPGIPLIIPGETITPSHVQAILYYQRAGAYFPDIPSDSLTLAVLTKSDG